jgi:hypothetical protein
MRRLISVLTLVLPLSVASVAAAQPIPQPAVTIDRPSGGVAALAGVSLARDGGGGAIYLKSVAGVQHVFVSRVISGNFAAPEQIDAGLTSASSQPVIAAGPSGMLLIGFINGGQLYVVSRAGTNSPYGAPQPLAAGAENPALALSIHGKGYLAFTVAGSGGYDVRAAYYVNGFWAVESAPLDASPGDDAGTGAGRPQVAAAGDGVGIVVWGEAGHVYSRRVWATSPSVVFEQADVPSFAGSAEVSADSPVIGAGDDSSFADVAYTERVSGALGQQSRVLERRLRGSLYEGAVAADGLAPGGPDGAYGPQIAESGQTHGLLTSSRLSSNQVYSAALGDGGLIVGNSRIDTFQSTAAPYAIPTMAGFYSALVAWQRNPGSPFPAEVRARYYDGTNYGPDVVISSPAAGPTDAAAGLAASGDIAGDVAVAWVQGSGKQTQLSGALLYYPPGSFGPQSAPKYSRRASPVFAWSSSREQWGPINYRLTVDGVQVAQTNRTSIRAPHPLSDGPHSWQVSAVNQVGIATPARAAAVQVDTVAPSVQFMLIGRQRRGVSLRLSVRTTDAPTAGEIGSGVASVLVRWGDGRSARVLHGARHAYARAGTYRITVTVTDRAGNASRITRLVRIVSASG